MYLVGWDLTKKKLKEEERTLSKAVMYECPCMYTCDLGKHNLKM